MSWHERRKKHKKRMALAEINAQLALERRANGEVAVGWVYATAAIQIIVDCGCDRAMWPESVRKVVPA